MKAFALEIRDRNTFIPALAVVLTWANGPQKYLIERAGYYGGGICVMLSHLSDGPMHHDPYAWGDRTYFVAHRYIIDNWARIKDGDVIDVEYILGETEKPKASENEGRSYLP